MSRTMFDAVNPANLPEGGDLYAGYTDGRYVNVEAIKARFPGKRVVTISVNGSTDADVLDVEAGNIKPENAPAWVMRQRARGGDPTVYCPVSLWWTVHLAFVTAGVNPPHWWVAHYDDDPTIPVGAVAKQYAGNAAGGYDISSVIDGWPDFPPTHKVAPMFDPPAQTVAAVSAPGGKGGWLLTSDGGVWTFGDAAFYGAPAGRDYWGARKPATIGLSVAPGKVYVVTDIDGETFHYPE